MALTKKQKEVLDYIHEYYQRNGLAPTQREIKDYFNLKSFGSVQRYIKYLADAGYIENDWNARRGLKVVEEHLPETTHTHNGLEIPLLGNVAAGNPIEAIENPTETIPIPPGLVSTKGKLFALSVKGDSMIEDGIFEDDIIICRQQNTANRGQTIVAIVEGEATVKHFFKEKNHIELHPANSTMTPIIVSKDEEFNIAGVLVGLIRTYE